MNSNNNHSRQNVMVDTRVDAPLLRFSEQQEGLLLPIDRKPVQQVVEALRARNLDVYLGGSVVDNALRGHPRQYNDIDLLTVGDMAATQAMVNALKYGQPSPFDYPGRKFEITQSFEDSYMGLHGINRFSLNPSGRASRIDLNLVVKQSPELTVLLLL